jgi:hypothetical protein
MVSLSFKSACATYGNVFDANVVRLSSRFFIFVMKKLASQKLLHVDIITSARTLYVNL